MWWNLTKDIARKGAHVAASLAGSAASTVAGATVASTGTATAVIDALWSESGYALTQAPLGNGRGETVSGPFSFTDAQWLLYTKYVRSCAEKEWERAEGVFSGAAGRGVIAEMIKAGWRRPFRGPYSREADPALYLLHVAKAQYAAGVGL